MNGKDVPATNRNDLHLTVDTFAALPIAGELTLGPPTTLELFRFGAKKSSASDIGFGRWPDSPSIVEVPVEQGQVHLKVTSSGAQHLRAGITLTAGADYSIYVWAPGDLETINLDVNHSASGLVWTPVTSGPIQEIVVVRRTAAETPWHVSIASVSHIEAGLGTVSTIEPKSFGDSAFCQVDIACLLPALNGNEQTILLTASRAVALMITTDGLGSTYTCTGTLLNSANYPAPILITANHCVDHAVSLTTIWFFSRTGCGFGLPSLGTQVTGGGVILWRSGTLDGALVLLNQLPPPQASYAGWDANPVTTRTLSLAIHHPRGDVKKASFGDIVGVNSTAVSISTVLLTVRASSIWSTGKPESLSRAVAGPASSHTTTL